MNNNPRAIYAALLRKHPGCAVFLHDGRDYLVFSSVRAEPILRVSELRMSELVEILMTAGCQVAVCDRADALPTAERPVEPPRQNRERHVLAFGT